jgi:hypothetical protein
MDSGQIVNAIHAFNAGLRVNVYFEYVRSAANIADFPSRLRMDLLMRALAQCGLASSVERVECVLPEYDDWMVRLPREWLEDGRLHFEA